MRERGIVPGEGGLFEEVETERRGGGLYIYVQLSRDRYM